jgi:hypothetical protein
MAKQAGKIIGGRHPGGQPTGQALSDVRKGACAVDLEQRAARRPEHGRRAFADVTIALVERFKTQQRVEVVVEDFGGKILLMREPAQPGDTFKVNAMLDSPKRFLHAPALMVERAELNGGPEVRDELVQYRVNPSSYREIVRTTTTRILPAQPRVYKACGLKLRGLGREARRR